MKHLGKVAHGKDIVTLDLLNDRIGQIQDNDTIYDDTELKGRVEALENKPDFDAQPLEQRITALESKPDQDTKYDTEVADFERRIAELERIKPKTYTEQLNGASEFTVTHGLGTDFIVKELWQDGFEILADVQRVDNNTLKVTFTEVVNGVEIRVIGI